MSQGKKAIREKFRNDTFGRDGHKCVFCDRTDNLDAHHITDRRLMPAGGYVKENGITLCPTHHLMAEEWNRTEQQSWITNFHPNDLYKRIGSSYEMALIASQTLERRQNIHERQAVDDAIYDELRRHNGNGHVEIEYPDALAKALTKVALAALRKPQ